jgi:hypothetical protein
MLLGPTDKQKKARGMGLYVNKRKRGENVNLGSNY